MRVQGDSRGFRAVGCAELLEDGADMFVDVVLPDAKLAGDVAVGEASRLVGEAARRDSLRDAACRGKPCVRRDGGHGLVAAAAVDGAIHVWRLSDGEHVREIRTGVPYLAGVAVRGDALFAADLHGNVRKFKAGGLTLSAMWSFGEVKLQTIL